MPVTTLTHGAWLDPTDLTAGSATYNFAADPGDNYVAAVWDAESGTNVRDTSGKTAVTLHMTHPGAVAAYNYVLMVLGTNTLPTYVAPGPLTYNDYRNLSSVVVGATQITRAGITNGVDLKQWIHHFRYYIFVLVDTTVAPGGNTTFGFILGD